MPLTCRNPNGPVRGRDPSSEGRGDSEEPFGGIDELWVLVEVGRDLLSCGQASAERLLDGIRLAGFRHLLAQYRLIDGSSLRQIAGVGSHSSRWSVDLRPLRQSRDLRLLLAGLAIAQLGNAVATVAVALEVFDLTHSSLAVGAASVADVAPMVAGMLIGGTLADTFDRRNLIVASQLAAGLFVGGLAINAHAAHPSLLALYALIAGSGASAGLGAPARVAAVPTLVGLALLPGAAALTALINQSAAMVGPAVGGLVVANVGFSTAFWIDSASFLVYAAFGLRLRPLTPGGKPVRARASLREGFTYVRRSPLTVGIFLVDVNAMFFGMPSAVFPALARERFAGGATVAGFLYAAPAAGALLGAATSGWTGGVRRAGVALVGASALWGCAIAAFGFTHVLWLALFLLALAGGADVISEVFRSSLLQAWVPDDLRGRVSALWLAQANGAPAFGNFEAGAVATASSPFLAVVSGGVASVVGVLLIAKRYPALRRAELVGLDRVADIPAEATHSLATAIPSQALDGPVAPPISLETDVPADLTNRTHAPERGVRRA